MDVDAEVPALGRRAGYADIVVEVRIAPPYAGAEEGRPRGRGDFGLAGGGLAVVALPEERDERVVVPVLVRDLASVRADDGDLVACLLYTSPSPRDKRQSRMPSSA